MSSGKNDTNACFVMADGSAVEIEIAWRPMDESPRACAGRDAIAARHHCVYRVIKTAHIYPPIPERRFDWCATFSDYHEGPEHHPDPFKRLIGWGKSEQEAIDDLHEDLESAIEDKRLHEFFDGELARLEARRA